MSPLNRGDIARTWDSLSGVWRHPHGSREAIVAFQDRQLRRLIGHAYANVPYYRHLLDRHGLKPADIRGVADLSSIPLTSKRDLQPLPPSEIIEEGTDPQRLITRSTGGSTGEPMILRRRLLEIRVMQLFRLRAMHDFGLRITDSAANIVMTKPWRAHYDQFPLNLMRSLGVYRHQLVDCLAPPEEILSRLRHLSPDVLGGLSAIVARVAQSATGHGQPAIRPRLVVVGGDVLTPLMRQQIVDAFAAPVFELYNSVEGGTMGWECVETGAFHTCDDGVVVEVLKDGVPAREGERGQVVITNLHAFAMPLIRYRLGDVVTRGPETCRCGKPFGTIGAIQGRMLDYFPLPSGRLIHPYSWVSVLFRVTAPWMRAYRFLQERTDRIVLNAVAALPPSEAQLQEVRAALLEAIGEPVELVIQLVDDISLERNGKCRISRSLVRSSYDAIDWDQSPSAHIQAGK